MSQETYGPISELISQICISTGENPTSSRARPKVLSYLNIRYRQILTGRNWRFLHRELYMDMIPPYSTGTVSANFGSNVVTGTGTSFPADIENKKIVFEGSKTTYEISRRVSSTELELTGDFKEPSVINSGYKILYDKYVIDAPIDAITAAYVGGTNPNGPALELMGLDQLRQYQKTLPILTGSPNYLAANSFADPVTGVVKWAIEVWPAPEQAYSLLLEYDIAPPALLDLPMYSLIPNKYIQVLFWAVVADMLTDQKYPEQARSAMVNYTNAYMKMCADFNLTDDRTIITARRNYYEEARNRSQMFYGRNYRRRYVGS